ncbi:MAG: nitrilase-related carbon-nitrogen hydrolase [Cytophagales bacterium]|nr:nitrilase-related carbon-nitrogen hydrolase [Cytophagales bacterium]
MNVLTLEYDIQWQNTDANLAYLEEEIAKVQHVKIDIIILPELFHCGFGADISCAEIMHGTTHRWMQLIAQRYDTLVIGSVMIKEKGKLYNRCIAQHPDGKYQTYDKIHLFCQGIVPENTQFTKGSSTTIIYWRGVKIMPLICFDIRFPATSMNYTLNNEYAYDLLVYVANWPAARQHAWDTLLPARAIENQSYVIGVNRTGTDKNSIKYSGNTASYDAAGNPLRTQILSPVCSLIYIDIEKIQEFRVNYPFLDK